jgi:hypothetical protein
MTRAYSEDLRERALARLRAGETTRSTAALLIAPSCISKWKRRLAETGSFEMAVSADANGVPCRASGPTGCANAVNPDRLRHGDGGGVGRAEHGDRQENVAAGRGPPFRPRLAVCCRALPQHIGRPRPDWFDGPPRQPVRQRQGRELHKTPKVEAIYPMAFETFEDITEHIFPTSSRRSTTNAGSIGARSAATIPDIPTIPRRASSLHSRVRCVRLGGKREW